MSIDPELAARGQNPHGLLAASCHRLSLPPRSYRSRWKNDGHLGRRHHHLRRHDQHLRRQRAPPTRTARSSNMYPAGIPCCYRPRFHRYRPTERTAPHRTDRRTDRSAQGSTLAHQCPSPQCLGLISAWRIDAYQPPYFAPVGAPKQAGAPQGWTSRWATRASHAPNTYPTPCSHSLTPQASSFSFLRLFSTPLSVCLTPRSCTYAIIVPRPQGRPERCSHRRRHHHLHSWFFALDTRSAHFLSGSPAAARRTATRHGDRACFGQRRTRRTTDPLWNYAR